ncbi:hypothetical protein [Legionella sp. CNM-4043-24]|uniref:hypothetical protein n=1 Tax=Legionella sp. CNM-4043-24 TaxID=3421646 RepID=UPI00403A9FBF
MGDFKSKLPDLNELANMTGKLFKDVKNSVTEIIADYKKKREEAEVEQPGEVVSSTPVETVEKEAKTVEVKEPEKECAPAATTETKKEGD